jgi:hypothetical protein
MVITRHPRSLALMLVVCAVGLLIAQALASQFEEVGDALRLWPLAVLAIALLLLGRRPRAALRSRSEPAAGITAAALDVRLDAAELQVHTSLTGDALFRTDVESAGPGPAIALDRPAGRVTIGRRRRPPGGLGLEPFPPGIDVTLSSRVAWALHVRVATLSGMLDLRQVRLSELDLVAADARVSADLPAPDGPVQVRLAGARLHATLSVPQGTHVRILPNETWAVEPPFADQSRDGAPEDERGMATSRYDVWLGGRGGRCRIVRRPAELVPGRRPALSVLA